MKKRILSIALVVAMIVVMIPAMLLPTAAVMYVDGYDTAKVTTGAITVDGAIAPDAAYLNSEKIISNNHNVTGSANGETNEFVAYTAVDDNGIYIWTKITDQSLNKGDGTISQQQ
jgi:predicted metal-binding membrane protein